MHYITLRGVRYPVRATVAVDAETNRRYNTALLDAEDLANEEADARGAGDGERAALIARRRKRAAREYLSDMDNSLRQISLMINAAVSAEKALNGVDISGQVPHWPMTPEKLAALATVDDLNREDTMLAIAAELSECRGGEKKNGTGEDCGDGEEDEREPITPKFEQLQYLACTVLGYSLAEYRAMRTYDIIRQWDIHCRMNRIEAGDENEGVEY